MSNWGQISPSESSRLPRRYARVISFSKACRGHARVACEVTPEIIHWLVLHSELAVNVSTIGTIQKLKAATPTWLSIPTS